MTLIAAIYLIVNYKKMIFKNKLNMRGELSLRLIDANSGALIATHTQKNLITNLGYKAAAQGMAEALAGAQIKSVQVGTSTTVPALTDTAITGGVSVPITSITYPDGAMVFEFSIGSGVANGMNIVEFGLFTQDGRLFSRLVRDEIIAKTADFTILGSWKINLK